MKLKMEQEKKEEKYIYVYGITNKPVNLGIMGLRDKPINKIDFKDTIVLTSAYPTLHPVLKEEEAMRHAEILKKISQKTTLIPMSFGMVFNDEKILKTVLAKSYQAIKATLKLIENKTELGVKVIKNQLEDIPNGITQEILDSLNKLAVKSVQGDKFSERLLLNSSFLVEKNNFPKFSQEIAKLEEKYSDLKFLYTGPWPPYSFVDIKIRGG